MSGGEPFDRGLAPIRRVFEHLVALRRWDVRDRLEETGLLDDWRDRIAAGDEHVRAEVVLWYHDRDPRRAAAESDLRQAASVAGGQLVGAPITVKEIRYHAALVEVPIAEAERVMARVETELVRFDHVMFLRPVGQSLVALPEGETDPYSLPVERRVLPTGAARVALLDGLPAANHDVLRGRLLLEDPDGWEGTYPGHERRHGTAVASLLCHGELDAEEPPLSSPVYCRPVLRPAGSASPGSPRDERTPDDQLFVDLLQRAVRRVVAGEGAEPAVAPSVCVVNLSLGDPTQVFVHSPSPWARMIDWLAVRVIERIERLLAAMPADEATATEATTREIQLFPVRPEDISPAVAAKAMLVHGAGWGAGREALSAALGLPAGRSHETLDRLARFLGHGAVDPRRVLGCTDKRATVLAGGRIFRNEAHEYRIPLPPALAGTTVWRRLTVTLAWLSPIAPRSARYRSARLWFEPARTTLAGEALGLEREGADADAVGRGTVQHEVFESERAVPFEDGDAIFVRVCCRAESGCDLSDRVSYALAVSLETGDGAAVPIYEAVRERLQAVWVRTRARVPVPVPSG